MESKWIHTVLPALLIHLCAGTVYCWSTFQGALAQAIGADTFSVGWAFSLAIFCLGLAAAFAGRFVERDMRRCALAACLCFSVGLAGTGLVVKQVTGPLALWLVFFFYGGVMGAGLGVGYITPIRSLMLRFPERQGLGAGIAITGLGSARLVFTPLLITLLKTVGLAGMFFVLAGVSFLLMLLGYLLLQDPEADSVPSDGAPEEPFRFSPQFCGMWLVLFLNIHCGLMVIPFENQLIHTAFSTSSELFTLLSAVPCLTALCNVLGRFSCASATDRVAECSGIYKQLFVFSVLVTMVAYLSHAFSGAVTLPLAAVVLLFLCTVNYCYGGGFAALPGLISERYGLTHISRLHGLLLTAWAAAGLTGNSCSALILRRTGMYENVLLCCAAFYALSLLICSVLVGTKEGQRVSLKE